MAKMERRGSRIFGWENHKGNCNSFWRRLQGCIWGIQMRDVVKIPSDPVPRLGEGFKIKWRQEWDSSSSLFLCFMLVLWVRWVDSVRRFQSVFPTLQVLFVIYVWLPRGRYLRQCHCSYDSGYASTMPSPHGSDHVSIIPSPYGSDHPSMVS
jgi:hypothetical protein